MEYTYLCDGITITTKKHTHLFWTDEYLGTLIRLDGISYRVIEIRENDVYLREVRNEKRYV